MTQFDSKLKRVKFVAEIDHSEPNVSDRIIKVADASMLKEGMQLVPEFNDDTTIQNDTAIVLIVEPEIVGDKWSVWLSNSVLPASQNIVEERSLIAVQNPRTISRKVPQQFTKFIRENFPDLVRFMEAYYEWTELEGNSTAALTKMANSGFSRNPEDFIESYRRQHLFNFPFQSFLTPREEHYTFTTDLALENGFELQCICDIPTQRTSIAGNKVSIIDRFDATNIRSAKWYVSVTNPEDGNGASFSAQVFAVALGLTSLTADADFVVVPTLGDDDFADLAEISVRSTINSAGERETTLIIDNRSAAPLSVSFIRIPSFVQTNVIDARRTYILDTPYYPSTEVTVYLNNKLLSANNYQIGQPVSICDRKLWSVTINQNVKMKVGDTVDIHLKDRSQVDEKLLIENVKTLYKSKGTQFATELLFKLLFDERITVKYPTDSIIRASDSRWIVDSSLPEGGYYEDDYSRLDGYSVLQDGFVYGVYSYIVQTTRSTDQWMTTLKNFTHPAGFHVGAEIVVGSCASMSSLADESTTPNAEFQIETINPLGESTWRALGPTWASLDSYKFEYDNIDTDYIYSGGLIVVDTTRTALATDTPISVIGPYLTVNTLPTNIGNRGIPFLPDSDITFHPTP